MKARFAYKMRAASAGHASMAPMLELTLSSADRKETVNGLLDSGAAINVIPFDIGVRLGEANKRFATRWQFVTLRGSRAHSVSDR
jgi:hypothetical protein